MNGPSRKNCRDRDRRKREAQNLERELHFKSLIRDIVTELANENHDTLFTGGGIKYAVIKTGPETKKVVKRGKNTKQKGPYLHIRNRYVRIKEQSEFGDFEVDTVYFDSREFEKAEERFRDELPAGIQEHHIKMDHLEGLQDQIDELWSKYRVTPVDVFEIAEEFRDRQTQR